MCYNSSMKLYHAGKEEVQSPEIRITKYTKDFSWGFYCTKDINQAVGGLTEVLVSRLLISMNILLQMNSM